jgi:hypothetical protein
LLFYQFKTSSAPSPAQQNRGLDQQSWLEVASRLALMRQISRPMDVQRYFSASENPLQNPMNIGADKIPALCGIHGPVHYM